MWLLRFVLVFALLLFSTALAMADVVPVSANRQISASGSYFCLGPTDHCDAIGGTAASGAFSVSDMSQALGLYNKDVTGFSPATGGDAQQTSNATANAITLSTGGFAGGGYLSGITSLDTSSLFSLDFILTAPYQVHIFGVAELALSIGEGVIANLTGTGTQSVLLKGPGVDFAPTIPVLMEDPEFPQNLSQTVPWDATLTLLPGQYMIEATSDSNMQAIGYAALELSSSFGMSLTADFTPLSAVPEPRRH
jgi:hypothetical protein